MKKIVIPHFIDGFQQLEIAKIILRDLLQIYAYDEKTKQTLEYALEIVRRHRDYLVADEVERKTPYTLEEKNDDRKDVESR